MEMWCKIKVVEEEKKTQGRNKKAYQNSEGNAQNINKMNMAMFFTRILIPKVKAKQTSTIAVHLAQWSPPLPRLRPWRTPPLAPAGVPAHPAVDGP